MCINLCITSAWVVSKIYLNSANKQKKGEFIDSEIVTKIKLKITVNLCQYWFMIIEILFLAAKNES